MISLTRGVSENDTARGAGAVPDGAPEPCLGRRHQAAQRSQHHRGEQVQKLHAVVCDNINLLSTATKYDLVATR